MLITLSGKNAIVCGSTQGIGKAIAMQFAQAGANVILIARNEDSLLRTKSELSRTNGQEHHYIAADFLEPNILREKVNHFLVNSSPIQILVNNSGGPKAGNILDADTDEFLNTFKQHIICNQILVQAVVQGMKKERYGRIINIISTSVRQPIRGLGVSNTIRASVASWSKTLSSELAPFGITVNNILPGSTKTKRLYSLFEMKAKSSGKSLEEIKNEWMREIPAGRFGEPAELAYAALFLASPYASYITGVSLPVDGGKITAL